MNMPAVRTIVRGLGVASWLFLGANGSDIVAQLATTSIRHQVRKTGVHSKRPVHAIPHETASRHMEFGGGRGSGRIQGRRVHPNQGGPARGGS